MKITVIGCGNAFSHKNYNQSFLVEEDGRKMLIDCGLQVPEALANAKVNFKEIEDIYISHLHSDHIGGLEYFAFLRYDWIEKPRDVQNLGPFTIAPTIIANKQLLVDLWEKSLRGGLESMEGFVSDINTFFKTRPIEPNVSFKWQGWTVNLIQQIHIMSGSIIMPSFGIMFSKDNHKSVYFVTDSQHCSPRQIEDFYTASDIIFQDCECTGVDMKEHKYLFGSGVHANYGQLCGWDSANSIKLSAEIKAKMWLSHYQDFVEQNKDMFGNDVNWDAEIEDEGFPGRVRVGMEFEI